MIDLPTKMLKELAEEGSPLPEAVIMHNLAELAHEQGTLEIDEKGFRGIITLKKEDLK